MQSPDEARAERAAAVVAIADEATTYLQAQDDHRAPLRAVLDHLTKPRTDIANVSRALSGLIINREVTITPDRQMSLAA